MTNTQTNTPKWTPAQQAAIDARGNTLVSAAAGTGKTAVLAQRCVQIIADYKDPTNVNQLLILTFTKAAAEEMRSRISQELRQQYHQTHNPHLRQQLLQIDAADISTIHSFCKNIITEHFHLLSLDPSFGILDPDQQKLIKSDLLPEILEHAWNDPQLAPALKELLTLRNASLETSSIIQDIARLQTFLDNVVSREQWIQLAIQLADAPDPLNTSVAKQQAQDIINILHRCRNRLQFTQWQETRQFHREEGPNAQGPWTQQILNDILPIIDDCILTLQNNNIETAANILCNFSFPRRKNRPKWMPAETADAIVAPYKKAKDDIANLKNFALLQTDYKSLVAEPLRRQSKIILQLLQLFDQRYAQIKQEMNCLDYADLEHQALRLLNTTPENKTTADVTQILRNRFRYVFVDEYQDINPVQDAIISKISRPDNLFTVGDIKQSIYGFRGSDPTIFAQRLDTASHNTTDPSQTKLIDLNVNFRSNPNILNFANAIFSRIMSPQAADINYDKNAALYPSADKLQTENSNAVELHILDETPPAENQDNNDDETNTNDLPDNINDDGSPITSSAQRQAAVIVKRIQQLVDEPTQITDRQTGQPRPAEYKDIAILMRSLGQRAKEFTEVLKLAGIPVDSQANAGYFEASEITDCLSLLKVLDNPQRDIELAALLRSPIYNISDSDLTRIRLEAQKTSNSHKTTFYQAVVQFIQSENKTPLHNRLQQIFEQLNNFRSLARRVGLPELIWQFYRETDYLSFVSAMPNGTQRRANLLKLHDRAIQFESFPGTEKTGILARFVEFAEKLLEQGDDWAPAQSDNADQNVVRIMSVHKSKGLEFPIVFLSGLNTQFNMQDTRSDCLAHPTHTLGLKIINKDSRRKFDTLNHQVITQQQKHATRAEEMRILYVALTRPRERLILVASEKQNKTQETLTNFAATPTGFLPDWQLHQCNTLWQWIIAALSNYDSLLSSFQVPSDQQPQPTQNLFSINRYLDPELQTLSTEILNKQNAQTTASEPTPEITQQAQQLTPKIINSINYNYPNQPAIALPAKASISTITHLADSATPIFHAASFDRLPQNITNDANTKIDKRLLGSATHLVIQQLNLSQPVTTATVQQTITTLCKSNTIPNNIAPHINHTAIASFFDTPLGQTIINAYPNVHREWTFTLALPHETLDEIANTADSNDMTTAENNDTVIVQGIIDLIAQTPQGLIIIDFKTDQVAPNQITQHAPRHYPQMKLYAHAASSILQKSVAAQYLHFLTPSITHQVP